MPIYSTEAPGGGEFEESDKKTEAPISLWMGERTTHTRTLKGCTSGSVFVTCVSDDPVPTASGLPWGEVSTLPQAVLTVIEAHTVDRRTLSILSIICRGV